jgi:hypothetical protein
MSDANAPMSDFLQSLSKSAVEAAVKTAAVTPAPVIANEAKQSQYSTDSVIPAQAGIQEGALAAQESASAEANPQEHKLRVAIKALRAIEQNVSNIIRLLETDAPGVAAQLGSLEPTDLNMLKELELAGIKQVDGRVVEGVFDGQSMVGSDGKVYSVPPNYASKSKLVEGDLLKLTITPKGSFIYKQIGPIERGRVVAELGFDATSGEYYAVHEDKRWSVIKASVTYFKGEPGDEAVLLVPKNAPSKWAAVENVIKKNAL